MRNNPENNNKKEVVGAVDSGELIGDIEKNIDEIKVEKKETISKEAEIEKQMKLMEGRFHPDLVWDDIDKRIEKQLIVLTDYVWNTDGAKYDMSEKNSSEVEILVEKENRQLEKRAMVAAEAAFDVAKHYFLQYRRDKNHFPWELKYLLRMKGEALLSKDDYIKFINDPNDHLYDARKNDLSKKIEVGEQILETVGLDCWALEIFKKENNIGLSTLLSIRAKFVDDFYYHMMADMSKRYPEVAKHDLYKIRSISFLATVAATSFFEERARKHIKSDEFSQQSQREYYRPVKRRWRRALKSILNIEKMPGANFDSKCENLVDRILKSYQKGIRHENELLKSVFGDLVSCLSELSDEKQDLFREAKERAARQEKLNKEYKQKYLHRKKRSKKCADLLKKGRDYAWKYWLEDRIEFDSYQEKIDFEWDYIREYHDVDMQLLMTGMRMFGRKHMLKEGKYLKTDHQISAKFKSVNESYLLKLFKGLANKI